MSASNPACDKKMTFYHVTEGAVDVLANDSKGHEHVIGRIALDLLNYCKVRESEHYLFDLCDADSAGNHLTKKQRRKDFTPERKNARTTKIQKEKNTLIFG